MEIRVTAAMLLAFSALTANGQTVDPVQFTDTGFLKASNLEADDKLGRSIAVDGDTLVIGAPEEDSDGGSGPDDNSQSNAGAAYVYTRSGNGAWVQVAFLKTSVSRPLDQFGYSVAISGDTIVVGAPAIGVTTLGRAHVFVRERDGSWSEQTVLQSDNTIRRDLFGQAVAIDGDTVIVGAPGEDRGGVDPLPPTFTDNAGAAYVFFRDRNDDWSQRARLRPASLDEGDAFG